MNAAAILVAGAAALGQPAPGAAPQLAPEQKRDASDAAGGFSISGSFRLRYEALSGQFRPGLPDDDDLFTIRSSVAAEYDSGAIRLAGELIDSRAYGGGPGSSVSTGEVNAFELVQAHIGLDLEDALGRGTTTSIDAGRFTMELGSQRLAGRNAFRNTTNAFTGIRARFGGARQQQLTLFYTLPHQILPNDPDAIRDNDVEWDRESFDLTFWGAFLALPPVALGGNLDLYLFGLDEDDAPARATRDRHIFTPGLRLYRNPRANAWDYEMEGALQFGRISTGTAATAPTVNVSAYFIHAEIARQFSGLWAPRVALEYDLASGDRAGGRFNRFDSLYGPRRPDFGPVGLYGPLGRANISSPGVRLEVKPSSRLDGSLFYRTAWLASRTDAFANTGVRDPSGRSGRFAGHQLEARARYWIVPGRLRSELGGALLFPGRFLDTAPNASRNGTTVYGYADLTATF